MRPSFFRGPHFFHEFVYKFKNMYHLRVSDQKQREIFPKQSGLPVKFKWRIACVSLVPDIYNELVIICFQ